MDVFGLADVWMGRMCGFPRGMTVERVGEALVEAKVETVAERKSVRVRMLFMGGVCFGLS